MFNSTNNGIVTGGIGEGVWTINGDGTFNPNDSTLDAMYTPRIQDVINGTVQLTLAPFNACTPTADSIVVTITPASKVDAGNYVIVCGGLLKVNLAGSINTILVGALWITIGIGTFTPHDSSLVASYILNVIDGDTLRFVLTTSGNGNFNAVTGTMFVYRNAVPLAYFYATNVCFGLAVQF